MQKAKAFVNHLRYAKTSKLLVASAVILLGAGVVAFNAITASQHAAAAGLPRDCDNNSIIYCGATTKDEFVQKYNQNANGDLKTVYEHFGLSPDELSRFQSTAKMGTVYKDGRVVVDGKVVGTNARSIGRHSIPGSSPMNIGGKTYYMSPNSTAFQSNSIQAHVMMNGDKVEFIALTSCGNGVEVTQPDYRCDMLNRTQVDRDTFQFSSKVTAKDGAKLTKVVYDFGDGQKVEKTSATEVVTHNYAKAGNYTAKVTAYFEVNGETKTHTSAECTKPVEVKPAPGYDCTALIAKKITRTKYEFTATSEVSGGATLKDASFNFGDNQTAEGIKPKEANKVVIEHNYAKEGTYTITATLNFNIADGVKSAKCEAKVTVAPEDCKSNPNRPECQPKECKPGIPEGDARCKETPTELPSTGPADMIGSALGIGGIVTAGGYYLRSRRDLLSVIFKR